MINFSQNWKLEDQSEKGKRFDGLETWMIGRPWWIHFCKIKKDLDENTFAKLKKDLDEYIFAKFTISFGGENSFSASSLKVILQVLASLIQLPSHSSMWAPLENSTWVGFKDVDFHYLPPVQMSWLFF